MVIMSGPRLNLTPSVAVVTVLSLLSVNLVLGEIKNRGWWNHTVFYQIYPLTFKDSNGDGIGDIKGIIEKLDHFVDIGIGGVWLSPIFDSPMIDGGYDIEDFMDIHQNLGTLTDFQNLVKEAKKRGLRVLLDLVPNHTSDKHIWFQYSKENKGKYADYYVWKKRPNNGDLPTNWVSVFNGPMWECLTPASETSGAGAPPKTTRAREAGWCYLHQFHKAQPDLNYRNPDVQEEMKAIIEFWLRKGVDGFRVDAVPHIYEDAKFTDNPKKVENPKPVYSDYDPVNTKDLNETYDLVRSWRKILDDYADKNDDSEKILLIEAYASLSNTIKYYHYGSIPFQFQFISNINQKSTAEDYQRVITEWTEQLPSGAVTSWVVGNHDQNRTASRFPGRGDQMTMLMMVLPGIAVTYNGEELGMRDYMKIKIAEGKDEQAKLKEDGKPATEDEFLSRTRDVCRTPMQWSTEKNAGFSSADKLWIPVNAHDYPTINLATEKASKEPTPYHVYKSLTKLRASSEVLKNGLLNVTLYNDKKVLAVKRTGADKSITLLINFDDDKATTVDLSNYLAGEPKIIIVSSNTTGIKENTAVKDLKKVHIPARGAFILESPNSGVSIVLSNYSLIALLISVYAALRRL